MRTWPILTMSWLYEQSTGNIYTPDGILHNVGYSGNGVGKNNPSMESVINIGPIPTGGYTMLSPVNSHVHGPYAISLEPDVTNNMYNRDGFMCHGDSIVNPGSASEGCIIQSPEAKRVTMWESDDHRIEVVAVKDG